MAIKSPVLTTNTSLAAMTHGFTDSYRTPFKGGIPIGINTRTQEVEYFDPWMMKLSGALDTMFGIFLGLIRHGKSTAIKVIAIRLMMLAAGYQTMRTVINDYKPEGKESEYGAFSRVSGSTVFRIADMQVNPFEERLFSSTGEKAYELGILSMAKILVEFGKKSGIIGHEDTALRIAVYTMLQRHSALWGPGELAKILRSLTTEQVTGYYRNLDAKLQTQLERRLQLFDRQPPMRDNQIEHLSLRSDIEQQIRQLVTAKDNTDLAAVQAAGDRVASYLETILEGKFGKMFGDTHSLYDTLTQRAVTKDWRGVDSDAETLMRIIDTSIKTSAIENHQLDLLPHLEIDDEKHKAMDNLIYARSHSFFSEISRGTHTCNLSATHRYDSMRKGGQGSELYNLANTIINNLGFVFIGKQNNDEKTLKELQDRYGLSNSDRDTLTTLPKTVFGMKLGEADPIRFVQIVATPLELAMAQTESATVRVTERPNVADPDDIVRFARENDLELAQQTADSEAVYS